MRLHELLQRFHSGRVEDLEGRVRHELASLGDRIDPGASIAVAVGSRGIADIARMVRAAVGWLEERGARPFIVPAMGSHGGATAEGQAEVLASYGVTEAAMGVPLRSSMEVVELPSELPVKLYMDALAHRADGVLLINRVKPHTDFHGPYESGLTKMSVIGLGKHAQALEIHRHGVYGLRELIPRCAGAILATGKIVGGLAVVEDAYDQPAIIRAIPAEKLLAQEPGLLEQARRMMPSLPVQELDLLVLDWMGKDLSGAGIDTGIVGRLYIRGEPEPEAPRIKSIFVRDLTPGSHGNAIGMGLADAITRRLFDKIDLEATYANAYTSNFPARAKIPMIAETDGLGIDVCLRSCGPIPEQELKVIRVRDTLRLDRLYASARVVEELAGSSSIEVTGRSIELLDEGGSCPPAFQEGPA
jgi:hypothetical protein